MYNLTAIKANVDALIKTNGVNGITGALDQALRNDNWDDVYEDIYGISYGLKGVATTGTNPGTLVEKAAYFNTVSATNQTYTNLGNITVPAHQLGIFLWNQTSWSFTVIYDLSTLISGYETQANYQKATEISAVDVSSTVNTITAYPSPAITSLVNGTEIHVRVKNTNNSTTVTYRPSISVSFKNVKKNGGQALAVGDLVADAEYIFKYNSTLDDWEVLNPKASLNSSGDVIGPNGCSDEGVALFDGTTGKLLKQGAGNVKYIHNQGSQTKSFTPNSLLKCISVKNTGLGNTATIQIGTTLNGWEITDWVPVPDEMYFDNLNNYFETGGTIYYRIGATGQGAQPEISIRFDYILNYFLLP